MISVVQRAKNAYVEVDGNTVAKIDFGLVILLGILHDDKEEDADFLANKIAYFRIFNDDKGKMNLSIKDINGQILVISQFTLCADWKKGRRPSFVNSAPPDKAKQLYEYFIDKLSEYDIPVEHGIFGAMMDVHLVNCGPVTFILDSKIK
ncbi:MAG: D-aminoacyl-tRNA deacylase [Candidatus Heimdallarchaeaceae archaeon]